MADNNAPTTSVEEFVQTKFDYIICGGGTAGLAVAARLSENPDVTVGVIEAGKYRIGDPQVDCPAAFLGMFEDPEYDWCLYSEPQVSRYTALSPPDPIPTNLSRTGR
jgi:choline dehydrogenase-like flavoprotein